MKEINLVLLKTKYDCASIEIEERKSGIYDITLYGLYEAGYAYEIPKESIVRLRDELNKLLGEDNG